MTGPEEDKQKQDEQKALVGAGVALGVLVTFGAIIKAALDQAAKKAEES